MDLVGKWSVSDRLGLAGCMDSLGIPKAFIDLSNDVDLQFEVSKVGDTYTCKHAVNLLLSEYKFKSGQQFCVKNWLGQTLQGTADVQSGNKIVENITEGEASSEVTIQKSDKNLIWRREIGDTVCKLTYTKL